MAGEVVSSDLPRHAPGAALPTSSSSGKSELHLPARHLIDHPAARADAHRDLKRRGVARAKHRSTDGSTYAPGVVEAAIASAPISPARSAMTSASIALSAVSIRVA